MNMFTSRHSLTKNVKRGNGGRKRLRNLWAGNWNISMTKHDAPRSWPIVYSWWPRRSHFLALANLLQLLRIFAKPVNNSSNLINWGPVIPLSFIEECHILVWNKKNRMQFDTFLASLHVPDATMKFRHQLHFDIKMQQKNAIVLVRNENATVSVSCATKKCNKKMQPCSQGMA